MFYIRPIARDDLPSILALSERTGTGLTTLPANRERLGARIERSLASFAATAARADACYMFVLVEGSANGAPAQAPERIVGISAIEAAVGLKEPWYNYHVGTLVHASRALDVYTVAPTLFLANDHTGHTELCSLFLDQAFRQGKNGVLLAKCRLLFIAEFTEHFAPKVIAELRGRLAKDGKSPFWEGLGRHFFAMEYSTADYLTGIGQKAFIAELMPKHPVYVNLLPEDARDAIGAVHADTEPARAMLEQEGFRYEGYVDIFDAGPTLECFRDDIHAVRQSQALSRDARRRGSGAGQPARRHPVAGEQPQLRGVPRDRRRGTRPRRSPRAAAPCGPHAGRGRRRTGARGPPLAPGSLMEFNFDGIPGPTHNYSGLAQDNLASERNAQRIANPRAAALQGLAKMRALAQRGIRQAVLPPHERPAVAILRALGFAGTDAEVTARAARDAPVVLSACSVRRRHVGGQRGHRQPVGRHGGRSRALHRRQPAHALPPSLEAPTTTRVLRAIFGDHRASPSTMRCRPCRSSATKAPPTTRVSRAPTGAGRRVLRLRPARLRRRPVPTASRRGRHSKRPRRSPAGTGCGPGVSCTPSRILRPSTPGCSTTT